MSNHFQRRVPKKASGFSWGRVVYETCISYRLFRRDHTGALHCSILSVAKDYRRAEIAADLKRKRRALRDKVDEIDLSAQEAAA